MKELIVWVVAAALGGVAVVVLEPVFDEGAVVLGFAGAVLVWAALMSLRALVGVVARRRRVRHYEVVGMLPNRSMMVLPDGYGWDDEGVVVRKEVA